MLLIDCPEPVKPGSIGRRKGTAAVATPAPVSEAGNGFGGADATQVSIEKAECSAIQRPSWDVSEPFPTLYPTMPLKLGAAASCRATLPSTAVCAMLTRMFLLAAAVTFAEVPQITRIKAARDAYFACMADKAVALGKTNAESADTILRAARALCSAQDAEMVASYEAVPGFPRADVVRVVTRDRTQGEGLAVARLLEARAAAPAKPVRP